MRGRSADIVPQAAGSIEAADGAACPDGVQPGVHHIRGAMGQEVEKLRVVYGNAREGQDTGRAGRRHDLAHAHDPAGRIHGNLVERGEIVEGQGDDVAGGSVRPDEGVEVDVGQNVGVMNNERGFAEEWLGIFERASGTEQRVFSEKTGALPVRRGLDPRDDGVRFMEQIEADAVDAQDRQAVEGPRQQGLPQDRQQGFWGVQGNGTQAFPDTGGGYECIQVWRHERRPSSDFGKSSHSCGMDWNRLFLEGGVSGAAPRNGPAQRIATGTRAFPRQ